MGKTFTFTAYNGGMKYAPYTRQQFKQHLLDHEGKRYKVKLVETESQRMRGYFEGAVVGLVTYYQEGMDHRNHQDCTKVREWLKLHFNGEFCVVGGVSEKAHQR